jgi:hypothetical protein
MRSVSVIVGGENVTIIIAVLLPGIVRANGEITAVAF